MVEKIEYLIEKHIIELKIAILAIFYIINIMKLILITGGSASGKTTFANKLKDVLQDLTVINLDNYYYDEKTLIKKQNGKLNWDDPKAFDWKLLELDIKKLFKGETVHKSTFVYGKNVRGEEEIIKPNKYVILEGIFSPYLKEVRDMASTIIYLDADEDIRYKRRLERDRELIPNFKEEHLIKDWNEKVIPTQLKYIDGFKQCATLIINTNNIENDFSNVLKKVMKSL